RLRALANDDDVCAQAADHISGVEADNRQLVNEVGQLREQIARLERDEAQRNYQLMVERAADEKLDGYRELGAKCASLEEERDTALATAARLRAALAEDVADGAKVPVVTAWLNNRKTLLAETADVGSWLEAHDEGFLRH